MTKQREALEKYKTQNISDFYIANKCNSSKPCGIKWEGRSTGIGEIWDGLCMDQTYKPNEWGESFLGEKNLGTKL